MTEQIYAKLKIYPLSKSPEKLNFPVDDDEIVDEEADYDQRDHRNQKIQSLRP